MDSVYKDLWYYKNKFVLFLSVLTPFTLAASTIISVLNAYFLKTMQQLYSTFNWESDEQSKGLIIIRTST